MSLAGSQLGMEGIRAGLRAAGQWHPPQADRTLAAATDALSLPCFTPVEHCASAGSTDTSTIHPHCNPVVASVP